MGYHLVNVILHACISLLIYAVGLELFPGRRRLAFLSASLFACHPIHADVVASVVGRDELISSFCFLLVLLIYLRSTSSEEAERRWPYWLTLPILFIGALSKASAFTLPFVVMAFDLYRFTIRPGKPFPRFLPVFKSRLGKFYWPYLLVVLAAGTIYMMMPMAEDMGANFLVLLPVGERIPECLGILARYLFLLIWPLRLSADYSYAQLSYQPQWVLTLWTTGGMAALVGGAVLALASLKRKGCYFLAVFIFAINYAIASNIFIVINVSMAERLVYMASWGFCLGLGLLLDGALNRRKHFFCTFIVCILAAYSIRTWTRNRDWKDNFSLFKAAYAVSPMSCRVNYNLGLEYSEREELEKAIFHYEKATRIVSWNPLYHLNLGEAYARRGEADKAIEEFREVVRLEPERAGGYINLGSAYTSKGLADQAIDSLMIAREIDPDDWRVYFNLGDAYLVRREFDRSARAYEKSIELNPDHWQAWNKLGAMNLRIRNPKEAICNFRQAIYYFPECKEAYNNLGLAHGELGEKEEAVKMFQKALAIDPGFAKARNNLARLMSSHAECGNER